MSISNLPSAAALDIIASASTSAVSEGEKLTAGIDNIVFTAKTGSYKARWANIDVGAGLAAIRVAIVIPWTNAELDARGLCATLVGPSADAGTAGQDLELRRIGVISAPTADTSKIEFVLHSTAGGVGIDTTVRFSLC